MGWGCSVVVEYLPTWLLGYLPICLLGCRVFAYWHVWGTLIFNTLNTRTQLPAFFLGMSSKLAILLPPRISYWVIVIVYMHRQEMHPCVFFILVKSCDTCQFYTVLFELSIHFFLILIVKELSDCFHMRLHHFTFLPARWGRISQMFTNIYYCLCL